MTQLVNLHVMIGGNCFWWLLARSMKHNVVRYHRFRSHSFFSNPIFQSAVRQVEGGGWWVLFSRGACECGFKFKSPSFLYSLLVFSFALLWLLFVSAWFFRGLLCLVRSYLASTLACLCRVLASTKARLCACKTRPNKTEQALYVDAVLALVKGTGLATCRVATHTQAVSTLRGGRDLHVLKYEPVARLDAEREP